MLPSKDESTDLMLHAIICISFYPFTTQLYSFSVQILSALQMMSKSKFPDSVVYPLLFYCDENNCLVLPKSQFSSTSALN